MRKGRRFSVLKKILALSFIISMLSNHIMILGQFANIALATEVEWTSTYTSNVESVQPEKDEIQPDNANSENDENISQKPEEIITSESIDVNNLSEDITKEDYNEVDLNEGESISEENVLTEAEIADLQTISANTELKVNKFIEFNNDSGKGALVDLAFKFKVDPKDYTIDNVSVEFDLPSIAGTVPSKYKLEDISENMSFEKVENSNKVILNATDIFADTEQELHLLLVYSEAAFAATEINLAGSVKILVSGFEILGDFSETSIIEKSADTFASYEITSEAENIYKGKLYANTILDEKSDFNYSTTDVVDIQDVSYADKVIIENGFDKIITETKEIDLVGMSFYKSTSVSVENFENIFGDEGYIEIYDQLGNKIGEIKNTTSVKNDRFVYKFSEDYDKLIFKLINVQNSGKLEIKNNKVLRIADSFSWDLVKTFKSIKSETSNKIVKLIDDQEIVIQNMFAQKDINLEETETRIDLELSTEDFVTTEENIVTFTATMKNNEERYEMFKNPVIHIELPSAVTNVDIKTVNLLYRNGLSLQSYKVEKNALGNNEIVIALEGVQSSYETGTLIDGITVVVTAGLSFDKITANGTSSVKLRYTNDLATHISYELEGRDCVDHVVNYVSRSGILKELKVESYNVDSEALISYDDKAVVGEINADSPIVTAKVSETIMNNYSNEIKNVEIVGKIPCQGNEKDGVDLNTTFNTNLNGPISLTGPVSKVYYSYDSNTDKDADAWIEENIDFSQVKSFKVVLENEQMNIGEQIEIAYNLNIPANVGYNAEAYNLITTYYDFNDQSVNDSSIFGFETEERDLTVEECQTVEAISKDLDVGIQASRTGVLLEESDEINEGQILRYTVVVKNTSNSPITNINIDGLAQNANNYYFNTYKTQSSTDGEEVLTGEWKEDLDGSHAKETFKIDSLAPGESKIFTYQVKVKHVNAIEGEKIVCGKVEISADNIEKIEFESIKNNVRDAKIELAITKSGLEDANNMLMYTVDPYRLITQVTNIADSDLKNVQVNVLIPKELKYDQEETEVYNFDIGVNISAQDISTGKMVTYTIYDLPKGESVNLVTATAIDSMDLTKERETIEVKASATIDGQLHLSNDYVREALQGETSLGVNYIANIPNESIVKDGDIINYHVDITNTGIVNGYVDFTDFLPYGLNVTSVKLTNADGSQEDLEISEYRYVMTDADLEPGQKISLDIESTVNVDDLRTDQVSIVNKLDILPEKNLEDYEELVFYIDPSQIVAKTDDGYNDEEDEDEELPVEEVKEEEQEEVKQEEKEPGDLSDLSNLTDEELEEPTKEEVKEETKEEAKEEQPKEPVKEENNKEETKPEENKNDNQNNEPAQENIAVTPNAEVNNVVDSAENVSNNQETVKAVKYSISGKAWLDENKNGLYEQEELLNSIKVMLVEGKDSDVISDSNIIKTATTDENGAYTFGNLDEGKYVVIFDYDTSVYEVSSYQVNGKVDSKSSDVVEKELKLNNVQKKYAVSDIVKLEQASVNNINMGLKENSDFDMGITTYVRRIIVTNDKGTEETQFDINDRIAKVEIQSKYLNSSNVIIEYGVAVSNNSRASGYINQISNKIPEGFKFDEKSNPNWNLGEDGILYTTSLNRELIASGETKELSLVLTKDMDENSTGTFKNYANIIESTNDLQIVDYNKDNESSEVDVLITVKTGAFYYVLVVIIALAFAFIAMLIVSKLIKDDQKKVNLINKIIIILSVIIIIALSFVIKTYALYSYEVHNWSLSTYFSHSFKLKEEFKVANSTDVNRFRQVQCIEGSNISSGVSGKTRPIVSVSDIEGLDFKTKSIKGTKNSSNKPAAVLAYMATTAENAEKSGKGTIWDYKQLLVGYIRSNRSDVNSVLNVSVTGGSNSGKLKSVVDSGKKYANNLSAGGGETTKKDNVTKLEYSSKCDGFGAIYATFPSDAKLQISTNGGSSWSDYKGKVNTSTGASVNFNVSNCSGKQFYIPMNAFGNADLEKVRVRIYSKTEVYKARVVAAFGTGNSSGQNQAVIRGKKTDKESDATYKVEAIANISINKTAVTITPSVNGSAVNVPAKTANRDTKNANNYAERGDYVDFHVDLINKGGQKTVCTINDTFNTSQYEVVYVKSGGKNFAYTNNNGKLTLANATVSGNSTTSFVIRLKVKDDVKVTSATMKLLNTASIDVSTIKINNRSFPNKAGNITTSSDYVYCRQYNLVVSKKVKSIVTKANANTNSTTVAEPGDLITYEIKVTNSNTNSTASYGKIYFRITENVPEGFEVTKSAKWKKDGNNYICDGYLEAGKSTALEITMKVSDTLVNEEPVNKTNTVALSNIKNRNNIDLANKYLVSSTIDASATVKILGYKMSISKVVTTINGRTTELDKCEIGDIIKYKITVSNTGKSGSQGNVTYLIEDTYNTNELEFQSATGGLSKASNGLLKATITLKPGETKTFDVTMKVILESKQKVKIKNTGILRVSGTVNRNGVKVLKKDMISSAEIEYQTYDMGVWKYIVAYNDKNINPSRSALANTAKYDSPVEVEKNDFVTYEIKIQNTGTTNMKNIVFKDVFEDGLSCEQIVSVNKYTNNAVDATASSNITTSPANPKGAREIQFSYNGDLNPKDYILVRLKVKITKTNMWLLNVKNEVKLVKVLNRNDIDLVQKDLINFGENNKDYQNEDYVRLKNLIISGNVWVDLNENGIMDNGETKLEGIEVTLHDATNNQVAKTYTKADGTYKFGPQKYKNANGQDITMVESGTNSGRVIKGTNRNETTGNYDSSSKYISYYIEFSYNGAKYKSTVYSGENNINQTDKSINSTYPKDSNATEYSDVRDDADNSLETIEYNTAIRGVAENGTNTKALSYTKKNHESLIDLTENTKMRAYSFVIPNTKFNGELKNKQNIDMLFLSTSGETEYLKYINLGLQTKNIDLSVESDAYSLKTTINGSQMTYFMNKGNESPYSGAYVTGGESKPINYIFQIYASDYYYKHTMYKNEAVVNYKENTEYNVELTFKSTIRNNNVGDTHNAYAKVREIADFYSDSLVQYDPNNNKKIIKVTGEDGYLREEQIEKIYAWYEYTDKNNNKQTGALNISNTPVYSKHATVNKQGYNTIYLTGFDDFNLYQNDSFDIYIKFVVDTEDKTLATNIRLGDMNNITEINAYSTYYGNNNKPAGYVDQNSNPGSLGLKTVANNSMGTNNNNILDFSNYENDVYKTGITLKLISKPTPPIPTPPTRDPKGLEKYLERTIKGSVWDDARSESIGEGGNTQYVGNGVKNIGGDTKVAAAESNKKVDKRGKALTNEAKDSLVEGVKVSLVEIINTKDANGKEGIYEETIKVYDDSTIETRTNSNGEYTLESFIPGNYIIRFNYGEDLKDVVYNGQEYKSTAYYNIDDQIDYIMDQAGNKNNVLTGASLDNILAKLEEGTHSDARDDEIRRLEVISYSEIINNKKSEESQNARPEADNNETKNFMKNTNMKAETVIFPIRTEKVTYDVTDFTLSEYQALLEKSLRYEINNIDFGIEYRPETALEINEFLSEVKLTTSDGSILADIIFDNIYESNDSRHQGQIVGTEINREKSIGFENLQYLPTVENVKGLAYLNVDTDLLQGCTIDVTYVFSVTNESEIDRISSKLFNLRYQADANGYEAYFDDVYTASGTAKNELYANYYDSDANNKEYRTINKETYNITSDSGYYGKYLGNVYYTGNIGTADCISQIKVDKILDYVDNNMAMETSKNATTDQFWRAMTNDELLSQGLVSEALFEKTANNQATNGFLSQLVDVGGIAYDVETRHNLAVSVDDKVSVNDNENMNKLLSKYLIPYSSDALNSSGQVYLMASKVISGEADTENMTYDNSAEIIQYTSSTGRITELASTVGNLDIKDTSPEDYESDSSFVARVTLTPPTGLEKTKYYASVIKDQLVMITIVVGMIIVVIILKRSLKNVTFKKFYK